MTRSVIPLLVAILSVFGIYSAEAKQAEFRVEQMTLSDHLPTTTLMSGEQRVRLSLKGQWSEASSINIDMPDLKGVEWQLQHRVVHANGDESWTVQALGMGVHYSGMITRGEAGIVATINSPGGRYAINGSGDQGRLLGTGGFEQVNNFSHGDTQTDALEFPSHLLSQARLNREQTVSAGSKVQAVVADHTIDILIIHTPDMRQRYGNLLETRFNHLVAITNQAFANSEISAVLRLVGVQEVTIDFPGDNGDALNAMANGLTGNAGPAGIGQIATLRNQFGADMISLFRPHDLAVRGSCGIAFFPTSGLPAALHVVADGSSGFSVCDDFTFAHEAGHNLAARHQLDADPTPGVGHGFFRQGQFTTIMATFGTGRPERFLGLDAYSNPDILCGGIPCGGGQENNAAAIRSVLGQVSGYTVPTSNLPIPMQPPKSSPDLDGDGVSDWQDAFPFDENFVADSDADGTPDAIDAFPNNQFEQFDTDGDGAGNNVDQDDDNDGVLDASDALPLNAQESSDQDNDGVGDNADAFPTDNSEWADTDNDGTGDNTDTDTDGDGVNDLKESNNIEDYDLLVISPGNNRVIRYDGGTGKFVRVEVPDDGVKAAISTHSDLVQGLPGRANDNGRQFIMLRKSRVERFNRATGERMDRLVESFDAPGDLPFFNNGFVYALDYDSDNRLGTLGMFRPALVTYNFDSGLLGFIQEPTSAVELAYDENGEAYVLGALGGISKFPPAGGRQVVQTIPDILRPTDMIFGPDGALYLSDSNLDQVIRWHPDSANSAVFVDDPGRLSDPAGLAFGPDGHLYISSSGSDQVLKYDGGSGDFMQVFSSGPNDTLKLPQDLIFVPKLNDAFPFDQAQSILPQAGNWYNPARSGHGIDLQRVRDELLVMWYTYRSDGTPTWYLAIAPLSSSTWEADLLEFRWNNGQATHVIAGSVRMDFSDDRHADFSWQLDGSSGTEPFELLNFGNALEPEYPTGHWYPPEESGWGFSFVKRGDKSFVLMYFYDENGLPIWSISGGVTTSERNWTGLNTTRFEMLELTSTDLCPGCNTGAETTETTIGYVDLSTDGRAGVISTQLNLVPPLAGEWIRAESNIGPLALIPSR